MSKREKEREVKGEERLISTYGFRYLFPSSSYFFLLLDFIQVYRVNMLCYLVFFALLTY